MKKIISVFLASIMIVMSLSVGASAATLKNLDLVFVVDTTGSMSEDIDQVKADMNTYVDDLAKSGMNYRVAIIDYRDFASRTYDPYDYPYKVQLDFSNEFDKIIGGINALDLGDGGDYEETICSALIDGLSELSWRKEAGKAVILMGDAPALDPEPITNYTKEMAVNKLKFDDVAYKELITDSVKAALFSSITPQDDKRSPITLFAVSTSSGSSSDFEYLAEETGGSSYNASTEEISEVISEILEVIPEVVVDAELTFVEKVRNFFLKIWWFISFQWEKLWSV